jgi:hypothetical protein
MNRSSTSIGKDIDENAGSDSASELLIQKLRDAEMSAHKKHIGMWAYGDPGASSDEDNDKFVK